MNQKDCCHIEEKASLKPLYLLLVGIGWVSIGLTLLFPINTFMMYLMGVWFLAFGLLKLYDLRGFVEAFCQYDFIARKLKLYGYILPFLEIILGLIYILNTSMLYMTAVNVVALIISLLGIVSAYSVVKSGKQIACACMWTKWKLPMTKVTVLENLFMAFMVVYMFIYPESMMNMTDMNTGSHVMQVDESTIMSSEMMTPSSNNDDAMREHCKMMPEMVGCEKYR